MSNILRTTLKHPLGKRTPLASLSRYVRWQIGSRVLGMPVVVPFVNESCLARGLVRSSLRMGSLSSGTLT